jgi:hypothetical protein
MYMMDYNETLQIEPSGIELSGDLGLDSIPPESGYVKLAKFDKNDNVLAVQDIYSYDLDYLHIEHIKLDNGNLIIEFHSIYTPDSTKTVWIGDHSVVIPKKYNSPLPNSDQSSETFIVVDAETLEYVSDFTVETDFPSFNQNWDVKDGFIYLRLLAVHHIVTGVDTFTIEHPGLDKRWVHIMKYDYLSSKVEWSNLVMYGIGFGGTSTFPFFRGIEVSDDGLIYMYGNDYGRPTYFLGNTINTWDSEQGIYLNSLDIDGSVMVLDSEGDFRGHYHIVNYNLLIAALEKIGEYTYLLMQPGVSTLNYRGVEIEFDEEIPRVNMVMKVDENGDYIDHWFADTDCVLYYNEMRKTSDNQLLLLGTYSALDAGCSNTTAEDIPFVSTQYRNGSLLTLDTELTVVGSEIFGANQSGFGDVSIPRNKLISSSAKYISYTSNRVVIQEELLNNIGEISMTNHNGTSIFPNPAKDYFRFDISHEDQKNIQIYMYTNHGILVKKHNVINRENIDVSDLSSGIYVVKIITPNNTFSHKLIKI